MSASALQAGQREELERLVAALERSGLADTRPDAAALLQACHARLGGAGKRRPAWLRRRRTNPARKLRALLRLLLDGAAATAGSAGAAGLAFATLDPVLAGGLLGGALGWGLLRWGRAPEFAAEAWFALGYALRWAWLWLAEPFSERAYLRLNALLDAREVMRGWRAHRRSMADPMGAPPGLETVATWLTDSYGLRSAAAFRRAAAARRQRRSGWTLRGGHAAAPPAPLPEARLMRWSGLITLFEEIAAEGALWSADPPPERARPDPLAPPRLVAVQEEEPPERAQRRLELRELIKKKRQDITTAYGWKLKTAAEIEQRDQYLNALRAEIKELERELAALSR